MAKDFGKAASSKTFDRVAKASAEKASVITVKMIPNTVLNDYPRNDEDIQYTADLENSIKELGFTDPIEVTSYGQDEGQYMIVSGHRRRAAGVRCGMDLFPCIIKSFDGEESIYNYVLLANTQRDSAKDPLLFCKRFKMHEAYLRESGFKGAFREEIAKRLGISTQQADRYNQMNKVILPVWDMVRDEVVGMSSVLPLASFDPGTQEEILVMMEQCMAAGDTLTRDRMKQIIDAYRDGVKEYVNVGHTAARSPLNEGLSGKIMNTDPPESRDPAPRGRSAEIRKEHDPINRELDKMDEDYKKWEQEHDEGGDSGSNDESASRDGKANKLLLSEAEKNALAGKGILKSLEKLTTLLNEGYSFSDENEAESAVKSMVSTFMVVFEEMYCIAREHEKLSLFEEAKKELIEKVKEY